MQARGASEVATISDAPVLYVPNLSGTRAMRLPNNAGAAAGVDGGKKLARFPTQEILSRRLKEKSVQFLAALPQHVSQREVAAPRHHLGAHSTCGI